MLRASDRRGRLRVATQHAHAELDATLEAAGFFDDRQGYGAYLNATWKARRPIERALSECGAETFFPDWPLRIVEPALRADIRDITGIEAPDDTDNDTPIAAFTAAQAFGVMYVLEGSALGGKILSRRAGALGMTPDFGGRHLALQINMPAAWPSFLSILEAAPFHPEQEVACVRAAMATFARFQSAYRETVAVARPRTFCMSRRCLVLIAKP